MDKENALKWFLGCYSENGNHRPDQYTYKCKKCGQWSCTYRSNRIGNYYMNVHIVKNIIV